MNATAGAARRVGTLNWGGRWRPGAPVTRKFTDYAVTVSGSLPDGIIHRELSAENLAGLALPFATA